MVDPNSSPSSKFRAADCILSHASKGIELENIELRVAELERRLEKSGGQLSGANSFR